MAGSGAPVPSAAVDETWNMQKLDNKQIAELGISFNSRIITVEKSREGREGQRQVFSLLQDYTYKIEPVPEQKDTLMDGPTGHMLAMLKEMNRNRKPWTIQDFVDHDNLGGVHRKRAIKYNLDKLEAQKLIERCDAPADLVLKGRRPNFCTPLVRMFQESSPLAHGASVGEC